jgi:fucose 4-O-acetylase-like acetyltransferase
VLDFLFNSKKILSRSRYPWIDYARGICIILVSFRHFFSGLLNGDIDTTEYPYLSYLNIFFFSFRMPLFFIVSGIFLRTSLQSKGAGSFVKNRFQTVFYPLLVWGVLHISLQLIFSDYVNANRVPGDYLRLLYQPRSIEQFWYLNALFFVSITYALVTEYLKFNPLKQLLMGLVLYALAAYFHMNEIETGFLTDVFFFYFFFAVGDLLSGFMTKPANFKKIASFKTLALIVPFFIVIQHFFTSWNLENSNDYYVQNYHPIFFAVAALVGGAFVLSVSFLLQKYNTARFLRVIGYHSLYIYVANLMITATIRIVLIKQVGLTNIPMLLIIGTAAGVVIPIIMYNLSQKAGAWWLYSLKKPSNGKLEKSKDINNESTSQKSMRVIPNDHLKKV